MWYLEHKHWSIAFNITVAGSSSIWGSQQYHHSYWWYTTNLWIKLEAVAKNIGCGARLPELNSLTSGFFFFHSCLWLTSTQLLVFWFVETIGQTTFATIMSVKVAGHTNSSTTFIWRALPTKATDFAILLHLIVFQDSQLNLLSLMLVIPGSGVRLLLPFLSTTVKSQHKMKSGLLLSVVVRQSTSVFQLLASKDQSLLVRRNSFLIVDLGVYIFCCIQGFDLESDGLPRQGLHENLHIGGSATTDGGSKRNSYIGFLCALGKSLNFSVPCPLCLWKRTIKVYNLEGSCGN